MSDTTAAVNKTYFDKLGSDYDEKFREALTMLEEELRRHKDFIAMRPGGRVLDYACGTGLLTNALSDQAGECIGVDVSETMIERYNAKSSPEGPKRKAYLGNLISKDEEPATLFSGAEFSGFDFAGVGMGFHHFDDPVLAARRLAERLAPGGVLFIVDFEPHGALGGHGGATSGVKHHGFTEDKVRGIFEAAGAGGEFGFKRLEKPLVFRGAKEGGEDMVRKVFFARGSKL
ncbi:hypothetical protein V2G26_009663 [Clonostachys chloroleuca]|uniref:Uncharacterized protein n=1 Tax=Clonostachys chloroleuca TaxID=1926264 RepID=A0AA35PYB2_9HYPO|nr:unnamed protein product [Clonostachys chloroleuca]